MNAKMFDLDTQVKADEATVIIAPIAPQRKMLHDLLERGLIPADVWQGLDDRVRQSFMESRSQEELLARLHEAQMLTAYQTAHIRSDGSANLVLGNYRILDQIGAGGMGIVYRGEHAFLRRPVAIKVFKDPLETGQVLLQRFFVEMRALARIRHPNVVWALDAGTVKSKGPEEPHRHYLVMEYVTGANLEQMAAKNPLNVGQACELIYQIAGALDETHKLNLIHRDIKPSNILVTPQGKAKLLDFGLALHFGRRRLTMPGTVLGTLGYMAPEQVADAANVDIRADIFGLGATLFFCLTGVCPFPAHGSLTQQAASRLVHQRLDLRSHRPEIAPELETVIGRMMAHAREERYPTPQSLLRALLPFVRATQDARPERLTVNAASASSSDAAPAPAGATAPRILIVDDESGIRRLCKLHFDRAGFQCTEASDGAEALELVAKSEFDLVLMDIDMPRMSGSETLVRLRQEMSCGRLKVIMISGGVSPDEMSAMLALGADDYLAKPVSRTELLSRTKAALAHKAIQDRSDQLHQQLCRVNADLEESLTARHDDLTHIRKTLLFGLAKIVESRTHETAGHLTRLSRFSTALARRARTQERIGAGADEAFVQILGTCAPLHDIGNVAMPDHILHHTGPLAPEDRMVMQAHTTIGAETLSSVARRDRGAAAFWKIAVDVSRHHHERFDGVGYPDRLSGTNIPLAARIVAVADTYDVLRTFGESGPALSHNAAVQMIAHGSRGRFDPLLVQAFQEIEMEFDEIFRSCPEGERAD